MAGPPDIAPSDLWVQLQALPRPHRLVDFPRTGPDGNPVGQVAVFVLTQEEQVAANAAAEMFSRKLLKDGKRGDLGYEAIFNNEGAVQVLWRACRDTGNLKRHAFPTPVAMREQLTADEVGTLFEHYLTVQLELGPTLATLTQVELDAWCEKIAEGGAYFLDLLSRDMQKALLISMASRLARLPTGSGSAGTPRDALEDPVSDEQVEA